MPNWCGIEGIKFECHGQQDGLLCYKEHIFNANDIQDSLCATFLSMTSIILGAVWGFVFLGMLMGW